MAIIHVTEATGGAPNSGRMSGTAGDFYAMMKYALPLNSWTIDFDDAVNFGLIARAATGNRFRLFILDNATASGDARLAVVRGCESATSATSAGLVDPFPTTAKIADGSANTLKSTAASTAARNFDIYVGTTWVMWFINVAGTTNVWEGGLYGDWSPTLSGDPYATVCAVRNSSSAVAVSTTGFWGTSSALTGNNAYSFTRSYDGTVKSTTGGINGTSSQMGQGGFTAPQSGPTTGVDRCKMVSMDTGTITTTGSASLGLMQRAYVPNLWQPLHAGRGALNSRDTFTDTAYNASATFKIFCNANSVGSGFVIVEETDTWSPPSG